MFASNKLNITPKFFVLRLKNEKTIRHAHLIHEHYVQNFRKEVFWQKIESRNIFELFAKF